MFLALTPLHPISASTLYVVSRRSLSWFLVHNNRPIPSLNLLLLQSGGRLCSLHATKSISHVSTSQIVMFVLTCSDAQNVQ